MNLRHVQAALAWALMLLLAGLLYLVFKPFLEPLAWAALLAIFFYPAHAWIRGRLRRPSLSALVSVLLVAVLIIFPVVWVAGTFASQAVSLARSPETAQLFQQAKTGLRSLANRLPFQIGDPEALLRKHSEAVVSGIAARSARIAGGIAGFLFDLFVMLFAMFFLFRDGRELAELLHDIAPLRIEARRRVLGETAELVRMGVSSLFVIASLQGVLGGLAFWLLGLPAPFFWGVVIAVCSFLPLIGSAIVWAPAGVILILQGSRGRGAVLLILGIVLISGVDNVVRPLLIAGRSELNGLLVFISLLGGVSAFGFLGLVLGPLLVATAVGLMKGYHRSLTESVPAPAEPG